MKAIRKSDGKCIEVKEWRGSSDVIYSTLDMKEFYQVSDLDFNLPEEKESLELSSYLKERIDKWFESWYENWFESHPAAKALQKMAEGGMQTTTESAVIEGWGARDRNGDLSLYRTYPERQENLGYWRDGDGESELPKVSFPSITWDSKPRKVKIEITLFNE